MSAELAALIFLLRMPFDEKRKLRFRSQTMRRQNDREKRIAEAVYASDPVEALKRKLGQLTDREWNDYRFCGLPARLR